ncbi:MAG: DUF1460 domain-containing protein [Bdellovibrionales bacterium]|nr:DUF1460 domain-containing protein [Bdellovibrionales bacterium]
MPVAKKKKPVRAKTRKSAARGAKRIAVLKLAKKGWDRFAPKSLKKWAWMVKGVASAGVAILFAFWVYQINWDQFHILRAPAGINQTPIEKEFGHVWNMPLEKRLDYWSQKIQDKPTWMKDFETQAKTQAPAIADNAPLIPAKFNCTTYVETVVALAKSKTPADFYPNLVKIRYNGGKTDFFGRNHFPEADWIPNNSSAGILRDVTRITGLSVQAAAETQTKVIDRGKWFDGKVAQGQVNRKIASAVESVWREPVQVELPYLPTAKLQNHYKQIPDGTVANLVRASKPKFPVVISHQGFVFQGKDGVTYFRHSTPQGEIKTNRLAEYMKSVTEHSPKSWPMVGLNFNQVLQ